MTARYLGAAPLLLLLLQQVPGCHGRASSGSSLSRSIGFVAPQGCGGGAAGTRKRQRWGREFASATCSRARRRTPLHLTKEEMIAYGMFEEPGAEEEEKKEEVEEEEEEERWEGSGAQQQQDDGVVGVISHWEAGNLLSLRGRPPGSQAGCSIDLGMSITDMMVLEEGVAVSVPSLDHKQHEPVALWEDLEAIVKKAKKGHFGCFAIGPPGTGPSKIGSLSANTNMPAALVASLDKPGPPTMVLGGFGMHRIANGMNPSKDTQNKIQAAGLKRRNGKVLDTCTGLGYTAIAAARANEAIWVDTIEVDDVSIEMCSKNPWSKELFTNERITSHRGDTCEIIKTLPSNDYSAIVHDPPARALCKGSDLYGQQFYNDLYRVLKRGGTLFHYIGNQESKEGGRQYRGVVDRLRRAGFRNMKMEKKAFGVSCTAPKTSNPRLQDEELLLV